MQNYAIVRTGGRQYRVKPGDLLDVETLEGDVGSRLEMADVLLVSGEDELLVGAPTVDGARVIAEVEDQFRGPKIIVFKYKSKTRYRRKNGHRQSYTRLRIQDIILGGEVPAPAPEESQETGEGPEASEESES